MLRIPSALAVDIISSYIYGRMLLCSLNIAIGGSVHASPSDATPVKGTGVHLHTHKKKRVDSLVKKRNKTSFSIYHAHPFEFSRRKISFN